MGDTHFIRVIVQGFDRLSGVVRDAANKSGPALDGLRNKWREQKKASDDANVSLRSVAQTVATEGDKFEIARKKVDRFNDSLGRLKQRLRSGGLTPRVKESDLFPETPEEAFVRAGKEGTGGPRRGGRFVSRTDFIAEESRKRQAILSQENKIVNRLGIDYKKLREQAKTRLFVLDDVIRGLKEGFRQVSFEQPVTAAESKRAAAEKLDEFDKGQKAERKLIEDENIRQRGEVEKQLKGQESQIRSSLLRRERLRDEFINREELELDKFKIKRKADLSDEIADDQRVLASRAKKNKEFQPAARERVQAARIRAAEEIATEEAATQRIITERQRRYQTVHRGRLDQIRTEEKEELRSANETFRKRIQNFDEEARTRRRDFQARLISERGDLPSLIRAQTAASNERISLLSAGRVEKGTALMARNLSDLKRGFRGAKEGAEEFEGEAGKAQRAFAQVGAEAGRATKSVGNFVNLRWLLVVGLVQTLVTVVVQLAVALVAIASSAVVAAGALGSALVAGILQALPVVGLLYASFHQLANAMKVVHLRQLARNKDFVDTQAQEKARKDSAQSLADAHYGLGQAIRSVADAERGIRDAHQRVTDAEKEQRDSVKGLAQARQNAARAIIDANFAEKDSVLSLQEAELGVLDAKQRLKDFEDKQKRSKSELADAQAAVREAQQRLAIAQKEGDQAEISAAANQLGIAKSNVSAIQDQVSQSSNQQKELELGVKRATLSEKEARVQRKRAQQDDIVRRRQGVEGSPEVLAAQDRIKNANRQYRDAVQGITEAEQRRKDAVHQVTLAHRSLADAEDAVRLAADKMSTTQRNAQREFKKLSPAEQEFVLALEKFKKHYKNAFGPITDIIISSVTRALNRIGKLLDDPAITSSFGNLATEIAKIGDNFSKWVISPEGRRDILFFINESAKNLPTIASAAGHFARALLNIGKAASPIFKDLVGGIDRAGKRLDDFSSKMDPENIFHHRETEQATSPLEKFLGSAEKHLKAWINLTRAIGNLLGALIGVSAGSGLKMVNGIADAFDRMADNIRKNPEPIRKFFERVRKSLGELLPILGKFFIDLLNAVTSKEFNDFTKFVLQTMIPALVLLIKALGTVTAVLNDFTKIPVIGPLIRMGIEIAIVSLAFLKLFPVLKIITTGFRALGRGTIIAIVVSAMVVLYQHLGFLEDKFGRLGHWIRIVATLAGGLFVLKLISARTYIGAFAKSIAESAIVALKDLVKQLGRAIAALGAEGMAGSLGKLRGVLMGGIGPGGPGGLAGMIGKAGLAAAVGVLAFEATKAILHITGLDKKLAAFGARAFDLVSKSKTARSVLRHVPGINVASEHNIAVSNIVEKYDSKDLTAAEFEYVKLRRKGLSDRQALAKASGDHGIDPGDLDIYIPDTIQKRKYDKGGRISGEREGAPVSAVVHVGEWVLNKAQQMKVSERLGMTVNETRMMLFGSKGASPNPKAKTKSVKNFDRVNLIEQEDPNGIGVWFIQMNDGSFGQVTARDAARISATHGSWIPGYASRAAILSPKIKNAIPRGGSLMARAYAKGGIVSYIAPGIRSFASGGVVSGSQINPPSGGGNTVQQHFEVKTEGESDWNYIMRLGAQHALESY